MVYYLIIMSVKDIRYQYRIRGWRNIIDSLLRESGMSLRDICEYTGVSYNEAGPSFYVKLPKKRTTYIGVGMAFKQPLDVINEWITRYGGKRKLYAKDISEDLVWIYLINANRSDTSGINYYKRYEEYQSVAYAVFAERWDEIVLGHEETTDVEIGLAQNAYGPEYDGIKEFVAEHMDAFKTAYAKPRKFLDMYIEKLAVAKSAGKGGRSSSSLNSLRGYLDDSMINFLCGDSSTINVVDRRTRKKTVSIKHIPKSRTKYISMCLALGMTAEEINKYLDLMGYAPLDSMDADEGMLLASLAEWERMHPVQMAYKNKYFKGDDSVQLTAAEEAKAVEEMLQLRADLKQEFAARERDFIYV